MAEELRFGFIGAGEIAVQTAKAVAEAECARLVAVTDANPVLAADLAGRYGAAAVDSPDELAGRDDIDVVYIAVPHFLHTVMAQTVAREGKHVLIEKPTGTSAEDAERTLRAARDCGVTFSVPFIYRYTATWQKAREIVADGLLGDLQGMRIVYTAKKPPSYWQGGYSGRSQSDWRTRLLQAGGGVLIMNCVHDIDAVRWATGLEAERVFAEFGTFATPVEVEDYIAAVIGYRGGAVGVIEAGSNVPGGAGPMGNGGHRFIGTEGQIVLDGGRLWLYSEQGGCGVDAGTWGEVAAPQERNARTLLVEDYSRALLAGGQPPIPEDAGLEAMKIISAAYQSRTMGRAVRIEELFQKVVMAPRKTVG